MGDDDRDLLLKSEKQALQVLAAANAEAERITHQAQDDAVKLLREQQARAADLLQHAREPVSGSEADENIILEEHLAAAELLRATESEVAAALSTTKTNEAVDVLMAGHREASAILLAAWMQVTEGRPSDR